MFPNPLKSVVHSCPCLLTAYSRIFIFLCRSGMCCTFILFYIFNVLHITTRQSYMKNHGIQCNTLGAVDSLNTQHCALLKHQIISGAHLELIQWVTTLIVPGVQMFRYSDFWNGQICSRPVALPPFFPDLLRCRFKLEKSGGCQGSPPVGLFWE